MLRRPHTPRPVPMVLILLGAVALLVTGCGGGDEPDAVSGRPTVVVTTNILGDVVENLVGDEFDVITIMPVGTDPHDFQPSAQQVAQIGEATVLIANGGGFEEGLLDVIDTARSDGVLVFEAISVIDALPSDHDDHDDHEAEDDDHEADHDDHEDHEAEDDDHEDEDDHEEHEGGVDPHFFADPSRMAVVADAIADFLGDNAQGIDAEVLRSAADGYVAELLAMDQRVEERLLAIPAADRVLVTNHEVFGYFADRYGFEVVGAVIPAGTTADGASARALAELAEVVEREGVRAIFADTSASDELARTLAAEVGDIEVVELFSESLGDEDSGGATYLSMVETNADRIATALGQ